MYVCTYLCFQLVEFILTHDFGVSKTKSQYYRQNTNAQLTEELDNQIYEELVRTIDASRDASSPKESTDPIVGWKMEKALRLATTHNGTDDQAREDISSRQFVSAPSTSASTAVKKTDAE